MGVSIDPYLTHGMYQVPPTALRPTSPSRPTCNHRSSHT